MIDGRTLELAIFASKQGAEEILKVYEKKFSVDLKEDNTPLTEADRMSHQAILEALESSSLPVLSEEGRDIPYEERKKWKRFWLVDPLDGTKEFVKRNGEFTVNIALIDEDKPVLGVILVPVTGELYFGTHETGARKTTVSLEGEISTDMILRDSIQLPLQQEKRPFTVVCSRSHLSEDTKEYVDKLRDEHPHLEYASKGSSLKLCLIAEGLADVYPRFAPTMEWDTAAGQSIVESSGGRVLRVDDHQPLAYNKRDLLNPWFIAKRS